MTLRNLIEAAHFPAAFQLMEVARPFLLQPGSEVSYVDYAMFRQKLAMSNLVNFNLDYRW